MELIFEGKNILQDISLSEATIVDSASGTLDSIEVQFLDTQGLWSKWAPATGNKMALSAGAFSSGECFVDQLGQQRGGYFIRALSAPLATKQPHSRSWEQVSLLQLTADMAASYGFAVCSFGIQNHTYARVDQEGVSDLELLNELCGKEGYALKVNGKRLILYDEAEAERTGKAKQLPKSRFIGSPEFNLGATTYGSCEVTCGSIRGWFDSGRGGDTLQVHDIYLTSTEEAMRYAKGKLRQANRTNVMLSGKIALDVELAGGSLVDVVGIGTADGRYMVQQVEHSLVADKSSLQLRKALEGY